MNFYKKLRVFICLVLVCTLTFGISPIKAKAVEPISISASAILGVTALALMGYVGFAMAPPDVDFIEDVGEAFEDFVDTVVTTGGFPDGDPNDDSDDLIDQITENTKEAISRYTSEIGDALNGNKTLLDPAIFGGFAGLEPSFKQFLKWMIQNGFLDRTVDVPAASGWTYYGDYLLPSYPIFEDYPYMYLRITYLGYAMTYSSSPVFCQLSSSGTPSYKVTESSQYFTKSVSLSKVENWNITDSISSTKGFVYNLSTGDTQSSNEFIVWSNFDVMSYNDGSILIHSGSEPCTSFVQVESVEPLGTVGSVVDSIITGGLKASEISLPEKVDFENIFGSVVSGGLASAYTDSLTNAQNLVDGTTSLSDYQQSITYVEADVPDESEPTVPLDPVEPSVPSETIPIDGPLSEAPTGDFLSNLGQTIFAPFQWIWRNIVDFFSPWIESIGDWVTEVRADIRDIPGKFKQFFDDLIESIQLLPQQFTDGIKSLVVPETDYLSGKVNELCQNFGFADSIVRTAKALHFGLANITTEPPVIYIDLGAFRGDYNIGGRVPFLDLRWYAEYKPTVDIIISAFLWICFAWRMFLKLPGIISGMPGDFVAGSADAFGLRDMLPARNADYAQERAEIRKSLWKGRNK